MKFFSYAYFQKSQTKNNNDRFLTHQSPFHILFEKKKHVKIPYLYVDSTDGTEYLHWRVHLGRIAIELSFAFVPFDRV